MKWCQPLSYHMTELNVCGFPRPQTSGAVKKAPLMKLKGIGEVFYELRLVSEK